MVQSKIRVFTWRVRHDILPLMVKLAQRKIQVEQLCPRCHETEETIAHAIRECPWAKEVWQQLHLTWDRDNSEDVGETN